jgi:hypothetical protein
MTTTRLTAAERREAVLEAALTEFAAHGYEGSSTEQIARRVGISQPYIFRLRNEARPVQGGCQPLPDRDARSLRARRRREARQAALNAIAASYIELLRTRPRLLGILQASGACDDPELRKIVRAGYGELVSFVERASGVRTEQVADFFVPHVGATSVRPPRLLKPSYPGRD